MSLLAVDIGSSNCKAAVFSTSGALLGRASVGYQEHSGAEMNPEHFWTAFCESVRSACSHTPGDPVEALCIASHGETFVPVNSHNEPVYNAILNMDTRAVRQADWMESTLGRRHIFEITGSVIHPMYPAPKILWLRENHPEIAGSAHCFPTIAGWIATRLGSAPCVDYSLASRYLAFDVRCRAWSEEILSAIGIRPDQLPQPVPAGTVAGTVSADAARETGLPAGAKVVVGGHDQPCGALGMGACQPGMVSDSIGTYESLATSSDAPYLGDEAFSSALNSYCHVLPDQYVTIAYFPSGIMLQWFSDLLNADYASLEARVPAGPSGLLITPHLIGTCNPDFEPRATGVIVGLRPSSDRYVIYKGILEGLACETARMVQFFRSATGPFSDIQVSGGGTHSRLGLQLRAALTGCRLLTLRVPDAVCLGAAILAGVAVGTYASHAEAVSQLVAVDEVIDPDPELARQYSGQLDAWCTLYRSLEPIRQIVIPPSSPPAS